MRHLDKIDNAAVQRLKAVDKRTHLKTFGLGIFHEAASIYKDTVYCFRVLRDAEAMPAQVS